MWGTETAFVVYMVGGSANELATGTSASMVFVSSSAQELLQNDLANDRADGLSLPETGLVGVGLCCLRALVVMLRLTSSNRSM